MELSKLFREARLFGKVTLYTFDDGTYACSITFDTIAHTKLEAKSGYNHITPESAVEAAIKTAKEIVESTITMADRLKNLIGYKS